MDLDFGQSHRLAGARNGWRLKPATPRYPNRLLRLLPSGPDRVHNLSSPRGPALAAVVISWQKSTMLAGQPAETPATSDFCRFQHNAHALHTPALWFNLRRPSAAAYGVRRARRLAWLPCRHSFLERCPSGRRSTTGNRVYGKTVSRVQIPPSPPVQRKWSQ